MTTTEHITADPFLLKLAKMLELAENAEGPEAELAMSKAQALISRYQLDVEVARSLKDSKLRKPVLTNVTVQIGEARTHGLANLVNLYLGIARANGVKCAIASNSTYVRAWGFDTDIEIIEALYVSLIGQMASAFDAYTKSNEYLAGEWHEASDYWSEAKGRYVFRPAGYRPVRKNVARNNFQAAFGDRIESRLMIAKREAEQAARDEAKANLGPEVENQGPALSDSVSLVLAKKTETVNDYYKKVARVGRGSWKGGSSNASYSSGARSAGDAAGSSARLSATKGIGGSRTAVGR